MSCRVRRNSETDRFVLSPLLWKSSVCVFLESLQASLFWFSFFILQKKWFSFYFQSFSRSSPDFIQILPKIVAKTDRFRDIRGEFPIFATFWNLATFWRLISTLNQRIFHLILTQFWITIVSILNIFCLRTFGSNKNVC